MDNYSKEAVQNYIERMQDEVLKIEYLLKSLKAFNMYETPELQDIRLPDFLEKFLALSKNDYEQKGITITASVEQGTEFCHADPRALSRCSDIFTNQCPALAVPTHNLHRCSQNHRKDTIRYRQRMRHDEDVNNFQTFLYHQIGRNRPRTCHRKNVTR
jgi:hypothetical protein